MHTTERFFITESGSRVCSFWLREQAEERLATLKGVMPSCHWMILTTSQCESLGIR